MLTTGTSIVPLDEFSLSEGNTVEIEVRQDRDSKGPRQAAGSVTNCPFGDSLYREPPWSRQAYLWMVEIRTWFFESSLIREGIRVWFLLAPIVVLYAWFRKIIPSQTAGYPFP